MSLILQTGKGIRTADGVEWIFYGYPLPHEHIDIPGPVPWTIIDPTSTFNVSTLGINHEVVTVLATISGGSNYSITLRWDAYRARGDYHIATFTRTYSNINGLWNYALFLGYLSSGSAQFAPFELTENGSYYATLTVTGDLNYQQSIYFTITGMPFVTTVTDPHNDNDWVEDNNSFIIVADVYGGYGVDHVNFYNEDLGTITITEPLLTLDGVKELSLYQATFNISSLSDGTHQFVVRAYDINGNSSNRAYRNIRVDKTPPSVSITSCTVSGNSISMSVSASDSGSGQNGFQFYLNDSVVATIYGSTANYNFTNLNYDVEYKVGVKAFDNALNFSSQAYRMKTTHSDQVAPDITILYPESNSWVKGNSLPVSVSVSDNNGVDRVIFYMQFIGQNQVDYTPPYTATFDISSFSDGQTLPPILITAYDNSDNYSMKSITGLRKDSSPPTVTINNITQTLNSITLSVSANDSGSGQNGFQFFLNDSVVATVYGSSTDYIFSNLSPGVEYKVGVKAFDNVLNYSSQVYQHVTTQAQSRPSVWEWSAQALNAFNNGGNITNLTADEWNNFTKNIKDVAQWKTGSTPTITSAISGATFTATMFNQAKNAIGGINATGIADKSPGSYVIGNDFVVLQDRLNGI